MVIKCNILFLFFKSVVTPLDKTEHLDAISGGINIIVGCKGLLIIRFQVLLRCIHRPSEYPYAMIKGK